MLVASVEVENQMRVRRRRLFRRRHHELADAPPLAGLTTLTLEQNRIGVPGAWAVLRSPYLTGLKRLALGGYINSTYRSLRNRMVGIELGAELDSAESLPNLLTAIFAFESRVRPFNKYLEWELRTHPLGEPAWADTLVPDGCSRISAGGSL